LGDLKIDDTFMPEIRNPKYDRKAIKRYESFYLIIFVNPKKNCYPWCSIEVHPEKDLPVQTYKDFLKELDSNLPDLKVSLVEYTIDLFCNSPKEVNSLFWFIRRCLYIPAQREVVTYDNKVKNENGKVIQLNSVYKNWSLPHSL
jgi:hypothetical protein